MAKTKITMENISEFLNSLPYTQFKALVENYAECNQNNFDKEMKRLVTMDLQKRLEVLNINSTCPQCGSSIVVKNGKKGTGIQKYKCTECNHEFTRFSGTILEKTRWHWEIWIKVLEQLLSFKSIEDTVTVLKKDYGCVGINKKTVWLWRLKLMHALTAYPLPNLTGVIQMDETFIREAQKGSRNLQSPLPKRERKPRYARSTSEMGTMGPEFATVVAAVDSRGYCVCKVSGMGKLTPEQLVDFIDPYIENPSYICSDGNGAYDEYCRMFNYVHYIKPAKYEDILKNGGYVPVEHPDSPEGKKITAENKKILQKLYKDDKIDQISNRGKIPYSEFLELKSKYGLNLASVDGLHKKIKHFIRDDSSNVSTKYLPDYIGFLTFRTNWTVKNGERPVALKDAEEILIEILKLKVNYTTVDVANQTITVPKPTGRYVGMLKAATERARIATQNKYFKFNEEDGVRSFNKRDYLLDLPEYKFYAICRECILERGYKKLSTWSVANTLLQHPEIDDIIYRTIANDRHSPFTEEDLEYFEAEKRKAKYKAKTPAD